MDQEVEISENSVKEDDFLVKSIYEDQLLELAEIRNPSSSEKDIVDIAKDLTSRVAPVYVKFPWRKIVLKTVPEQEFFEIKTNRNQLLISKDEQEQLYGMKVSVAGMSVGSSLLFGLVGSGFGKHLALADDDVFSTSNLNRVQATTLEVSESKVLVAKRRALEMNPFLKITSYNKRITPDNVDDFLFNGDTNVIFEEIDDFKMKVVLREEAKKKKIPLIMLTNIGDNVMIDVERYDTQPETELFNGLVSSELISKIKTSEIDQEMMKQLSLALVDRNLVPEEAVLSLQQIGETLVGRPQLYGTVALDGGIAPYLVRQILSSKSVKSGRYSLKLEGSFLK